jgi:phosphatidate cytidylyltransferase
LNGGPKTIAPAARTGKYAELPARIASAIVLIGLSLYSTWAGGLTFSLLALAGAVLIFQEFRGIVASSLPLRVALFGFGFLCLAIAAHMVGRTGTALILVACAALALTAWELLISRSAWGATALVYAFSPFVAVVELRRGGDGLFLIAFLFACVWAADTFAYFSGKTFGGPKLAPRISPNKTWSGFVGGLAGATLASYALAYGFGHGYGFAAFALTIGLTISAQIGDLAESFVKRLFGVKDSGRIIPGHGGILDRIDGLIFAAVTALLIALVIAPAGSAFEPANVLVSNFFSPTP